MVRKLKTKTQPKLPKYVYPAGKKYKVRIEHMDIDDYGETIGHEKLIKISSDPKKTKDHYRTLFHEYIHAVLHSTGLTQIFPTDPGNVEEAVVMALEEHLFHLINVERLGKKP